MIKKVIIILAIISIRESRAQNLIQQQVSNVGLTNQSVLQQRNNPLVASNIQNRNVTNYSNQNKVNPTNRMLQQQVVAQRNTNPVSQIQNDDIQVLVNVAENNVGNEFILIQQISNVAAPALMNGNGNSFELKLPSVNLSFNNRIRKASSASDSKKYKMAWIENKFKKVNRNLRGKFSGTKRLKIKVDDCFKW